MKTILAIFIVCSQFPAADMVSFSYRDGVRPVSLRQPAMPRKYLRISQRRLRASSGFHLVRPWPKERVTALSIFMAGIADSRARHSAADRYRLTLKRYAPIASAAAFPARHAVWQHVLHGFCGAILPDLSLRGGRRPTWQSREGSYVFAGSTQLSGQVLRDSPVASLLGMAILIALRRRITTAIRATAVGAH